MEKKVLLITRSENKDVVLAGSNVEKLYINALEGEKGSKGIAIFDVLKADKIVIEAEALAHVQAMLGGQQQ